MTNTFIFIDTEEKKYEHLTNLKAFIYNWNENMGTDYKTVGDFNTGEDYYKIYTSDFHPEAFATKYIRPRTK